MMPEIIERLFSIAKRPPVSTAQNLEAIGRKELPEPDPPTVLQVMISDAVRNGVREGIRESRNPVEILCSQTVSHEELYEFLSRKKGKQMHASCVSHFINKHGITEVSHKIYPLAEVIKAIQGRGTN